MYFSHASKISSFLFSVTWATSHDTEMFEIVYDSVCVTEKYKYVHAYTVASSPGPSHVFNVARRKGRGPGTRSHVHGVITRHTTRAKRSLREAARFQLQNLIGRFVSTL